MKEKKGKSVDEKTPISKALSARAQDLMPS